jgi:hypothetical protein
MCLSRKPTEYTKSGSWYTYMVRSKAEAVAPAEVTYQAQCLVKKPVATDY